jgi:hypothetical protein
MPIQYFPGVVHVSDFEAIVSYSHGLIAQGGGVYADVNVNWAEHDPPYYGSMSGPVGLLGDGKLGVKGTLTDPEPWPSSPSDPIELSLEVGEMGTTGVVRDQSGHERAWSVSADGFEWIYAPLYQTYRDVPPSQNAATIRVSWPVDPGAIPPSVQMSLNYLSPALMALLKRRVEL